MIPRNRNQQAVLRVLPFSYSCSSFSLLMVTTGFNDSSLNSVHIISSRYTTSRKKTARMSITSPNRSSRPPKHTNIRNEFGEFKPYTYM